MDLRITTLIENNPDDKNELCFEHGLSLLIEADGKRILFDTGQSGDFIKNAFALNQNLENLDFVIISHGHYDHSGGFEKLVEKVKKVPQLVVGEEFFRPKYKTLSENEYKFNGVSFSEDYISEKGILLNKVKEDVAYLTENIIVFHHFKQSNDFEKRNSKFFYKENKNYFPDEFDDEICLGIATEKGLFVIAGCSHVGIVNILNTIAERVTTPIYAVIGGTHLVEASAERIEKTIASLKNMKIQLVAVSHCTGQEGIRSISCEFKEKFLYNNTGKIIEIQN
ncbi:MAG: MBL fold metallo-hydrolase [Lachnospiraceae bacterium]|nr:MBL fold metallo-hydrolase [Lachnospiraceae bacterium]